MKIRPVDKKRELACRSEIFLTIIAVIAVDIIGIKRATKSLTPKVFQNKQVIQNNNGGLWL